MAIGNGAYILSASMISPQESFQQLLAHTAVYSGEKLHCIEPDYTKYIDPKLIRRMSRVIKMGAATAMECLQTIPENKPDAIITGTAYGCLADTDQFLTRMVEFNEELLSPTAFIQSTHNTVGAQIALQLKCHNYNNTYVHRGASFEAALLDALSLIAEGDAERALVGGVDEITDKSHAILRRFGLYKTAGSSGMLIESTTKGTMAGEGAAFFLIAKSREAALARLDRVQTYYKPTMETALIIERFLEESDLSLKDIDLVILGNNGDIRSDEHYKGLRHSVFEEKDCISYKQYCGEYPTSSSFALWMASNIIKTGKVPGRSTVQAPERILIYNNYKLQYPSLYLLSAC